MIRNRIKKSVNKGALWQLFQLLLCIYVLAALAVEVCVRLPADISELLRIIDNAVCLIFLCDFFYQLIKAEKKWCYLKWGWIDFVSSIPNVQILRWGRLARVFRIFRVLRAVRSFRQLTQIIFANRSKGTFFVTAMFAIVLLIFSSISILIVENAPESNIKEAGDALWWSIVTMTTVGYGDFYPVTLMGRIMAVLLMCSGIGVFGTFTAYISKFFVEPNDEAELKREELLLEEIQSLRKQFSLLEERLSREEPGE